MSLESLTAKLPRWQLESLYPSLDSQQYEGDKRRLRSAIDDLDRYFTANGVRGNPEVPEPVLEAGSSTVAAVLEGALDRLEKCESLLATLLPYLNLRVATDAFDERSHAEASALGPYTTIFEALSARFKAWLSALDITELATQAQRIKDHEYMLLRYKMESQHLLSDEGEELAAALDETGGSSWAKLYTNLIARQTITAPVTTDSDQETGAPLAGEFVVAELRALQSSRDRDVRRRAFEAEVALLRRNAVPFAAAMNGIKGQVEALAQRRGWSGAFEYSLFQHGITRASLDAMQSACAERFDDLRGYLLTKARLLGTEKLAWYDLFAPLPQAETPSYTWPEAKAFVVERFATYSDLLATFAQRTFDEGWLDVPPRKGKRNGAFCSAIHPRGESRVMLNFTGNAGDIRTLAHELGHAYHNDCMVRSGRDVLQVPTPMTLAETASIFCETIVFQDQLQASSGPIRLALLEQDLQQVTQLVIDIHSRFLFEAGVFEKRRVRDLSVDELDALMIESQDHTYGDTLDSGARHPMMWAHKGHYYSSGLSFYNYPYTFGFLFGLGLYAQYQQGSAGFAERYDELLASTGMADAAALARGFGIDIEDEAFWRGSLDVITQRVAAFHEAAG